MSEDHRNTTQLSRTGKINLLLLLLLLLLHALALCLASS